MRASRFADMDEARSLVDEIIEGSCYLEEIALQAKLDCPNTEGNNLSQLFHVKDDGGTANESGRGAASADDDD